MPNLLQPPAEQFAGAPGAVPLVLVDVGRVQEHLDLAELAHDLLLLLEEHLAARQLRTRTGAHSQSIPLEDKAQGKRNGPFDL